MTKELTEDLDDMVLHRPEWIKWYYTRWAESTALFDAEQKGWYFNLLMYAASQGEPPGYLEDNEQTLKEIAQYVEIPKDLLDLLSKGVNSNTIAVPYSLQDIRVLREEKWRKVRRKFRKSTEFTGMIYNSRLVNTLKDAYESYQTLRRAGRAGAEARWSKRKDPNDVNSNATVNSKMATPLPLPYDPHGNIDKDKELKIGIETIPPKAGVNKRTAAPKKKPETLFDEEKFVVTERMREVILRKFPEFVEGDIEYMVEKFKNVYHGKRYASWSRAFYNFITNQVVLYNYRPGSFNWREEGGQSGGKGLRGERESAAERNDRLEREAAEYTRSLLSSGNRDSAEDSEALSLTPDDFG